MARAKAVERGIIEDARLGLEIPFTLDQEPNDSSKTVRILFPRDALFKNPAELKVWMSQRLLNPTARDKTNFDELATHLLWTILSNKYSTRRLGTGLIEFSLSSSTYDRRAIRSVLLGHQDLDSLVEVGYRSTRLDLAGQPIPKHRAYLGSVIELDDETVLLETDFGLRRFFIDSIGWAASSPSNSRSMGAIDFTFTAVNQKHYLSYKWLSQEEVQAEEPRDVFLAEEESVNKDADGGLTRIPVDRMSMRLLAPFLGKRVYLEHFTRNGDLSLATIVKLTKGDWNPDRNYPLQHYSLILKSGKKDVLSTADGGFLRIGLLKDLPESKISNTKESDG